MCVRASRSICLSLKLLDVDCPCIDNPTVWGLVKTFLQATCCNEHSCCSEPGHRRSLPDVPKRKRGLKRRPLSPGITLAPTQIGWREVELAEHIWVWMSKHWPYIFGTSNGISAQVDQVEDKCLGFIACKHRGRGTRHYAGNTEQMDLCQSRKQSWN